MVTKPRKTAVKKKAPIVEIMPEDVAISNQEIATIGHNNAPALNDVDKTLMTIERMLLNPELDIAKANALLDLQERILKRRELLLFNEDMCKAQEEMPTVAATHVNKMTNSKHAKLENILESTKPIYTKYGFSVSFDSVADESKFVKIYCRLGHRSGYVETKQLSAPLDTEGSKGNANKTSIQGLGSTITYLRRYLFCMIFNIAIMDEDKDGNAPKKTPPKDEFNQHVKKEGKNMPMPESKPIITEDEEWNGQVNYGKQKITIPNADIAEAAKEIMRLMEKHKTKKTRLQIINLNLHVIREMAKKTMMAEIEAFHKFADEGTAEVKS